MSVVTRLRTGRTLCTGTGRFNNWHADTTGMEPPENLQVWLQSLALRISPPCFWSSWRVGWKPPTWPMTRRAAGT
jgi:hypothetical protein